MAATIAVVLISIPAYLYWTYSPEAVHRRGLATAFWLSLENDGREITLSQGETKTAHVELHHWKELDTALYVELISDDGSGNMDKYPDGLSVSFDLDGSVISLSKGAIMVQSKNYPARFNPPAIKQVSSDGQMVVREIGNLTVFASQDVPAGTYYFELSSGDTKIDGGGGNSQLLTVNIIGDGEEPIAERTIPLKLISLQAYTHTHELIGDVVPDMEFKKGEFVFFNATFSNTSPTTDMNAVTDFIVTLGIRDESEMPKPDEISIVSGATITIPAGGSISVEHSWLPTIAGDFKLMVFSLRKSDLSSTKIISPVAVIPIKVIE
jgi:hypothetical protein